MKYRALFVFFFILNFYFSQNQLTAINSKNQQPVEGAAVYCEDDLLGKTDANGKLTFKPQKCKKLEIIANNFNVKEVSVAKEMRVFLSPSSEKYSNIDKIVLTNKSDERALKMLDEIYKRFKENAPESLDSYNFKSYSKITIDVDKDSLSTYQDFITKRKDSLSKEENRVFKQNEKEKKDSILGEEFINATKKSQFFIWEKATEHKFSKKFGKKTNILDSRMSGFPNPIYESFAVNLSYLNKIPKQIKPENRKLYRFYLSDTLEIDDRTTYVIRFKELKNKLKQNPRKFDGKIYVDAENYALKKLETISRKENESNGIIIWKPIHGKWFLDSEDIKAKLGYVSFSDSQKNKNPKDEKSKIRPKKFSNFAIIKNKYFDFETNVEQESKDFKGYSMTVKNADGSLLSAYRTDSLTKRESMTYKTIDTLFEKANLSKKITGFTALVKGKLRWKKIDFDLSRLIGYNGYEGFRMGIAPKMNEKFHSYISPDAYLAYGFKDGKIKYGVGMDIKTTLEKNSFFRAEYFNDVKAAGRFNENFWDFQMKINNAGVALNNNRFYSFKGFKISYENDLSNTLEMQISARKQKEEALFEYNYKKFGNSFDNYNMILSLQYSPFSKNIMTPTGKFNFEKKLPDFFFNYEQGINAIGGDFSYSKFDAMINHSFRTKIGTTGIRLFGGILLGDAPIWHHFTMNGLSGNKNLQFNLTSYLGFATMNGGKYYNDKFVGNYITHQIPWYFKVSKRNISSINLVYRSTIGNMKNPEFHQFDFQKLNHLYQETGLEWNNFFSRWFDLGLFYRVGYYNTPKFMDNFAVQLKISFLDL